MRETESTRPTPVGHHLGALLAAPRGDTTRATGGNMHVPPENQGQMVEVSYGWRDDGRLYRRVFDRSDRSESWAVARDSETLRDYQESSSELWNEPPPEKITWKPCEAPKAKEV